MGMEKLELVEVFFFLVIDSNVGALIPEDTIVALLPVSSLFRCCLIALAANRPLVWNVYQYTIRV
jgi:hypothetical protein